MLLRCALALAAAAATASAFAPLGGAAVRARRAPPLRSMRKDAFDVAGALMEENVARGSMHQARVAVGLAEAALDAAYAALDDTQEEVGVAFADRLETERRQALRAALESDVDRVPACALGLAACGPSGQVDQEAGVWSVVYPRAKKRDFFSDLFGAGPKDLPVSANVYADETYVVRSSEGVVQVLARGA